MVKIFRRANGKLYLEYEAYGKKVQKSTRLLDTPKNRKLIKSEVIPALQFKIVRGDFKKGKPKTFSYYSDIYLSDKKHLKSYLRTQRQVILLNGFFGDIHIDELKRYHIKKWIREALEKMSPKTVRNYLTSVRGTIGVAIDYEVITVNVANDIKLPKHYRKEVEPFSQDEVRKLLSHANSFLQSFLAVAFYTGMRRGEVMGLMYSDIDFENKVIHVKRSITDGKISTPKTEKSIRSVPIFDDLLPYLKKPKKSLWLFSNDEGSHLTHFRGAKYRDWCKLLKECEIEYRKIYATRHTFIVSMLKYTNLSILEIAQMVGHTNTQMIIQNYGKYIKGEHLKVDRSLSLFTDKSADSIA